MKKCHSISRNHTHLLNSEGLIGMLGSAYSIPESAMSDSPDCSLQRGAMHWLCNQREDIVTHEEVYLKRKGDFLFRTSNAQVMS